MPRGDWPWPDELRQRYVAARKMIGMLPVGTRPGDDDAAAEFLLEPADVAISMPGSRAACRHGATKSPASGPRSSARLEARHRLPQLARASYRDAIQKHWHRGRLVLAGDAAHAMSPQLGQGVNMALMDAMALRDALRDETELPAALAQYQRVRRRHVSIYHFWSHWLTPLFQSDRDMVAQDPRCQLPAAGQAAGRPRPHAAHPERHPARLVRQAGLANEFMAALALHRPAGTAR